MATFTDLNTSSTKMWYRRLIYGKHVLLGQKGKQLIPSKTKLAAYKAKASDYAKRGGSKMNFHGPERSPDVT